MRASSRASGVVRTAVTVDQKSQATHTLITSLCGLCDIEQMQIIQKLVIQLRVRVLITVTTSQTPAGMMIG